MSIIQFPWTQSPQYPVEIDRSNPLGRTITNLIRFGVENRDIVTNQPVTYGAGGTVEASPYGKVLDGAGSSAARASVPLDLSAHDKLSLSFWMYWDSYADNDNLAMEFSSISTAGFTINPNNSATSGTFAFLTRSAGSAVYKNCRFPRPSGGWHHYVFTFDRTASAGNLGLTLSLDGVRRSLTTVDASAITGNFASATLHLLSRGGTSLRGVGKFSDIVIRGGTILSATEAAEEYRNPWQIFQPINRSWWFGGSSSSPIDLVGAAASVATASGALTTAISLAGAAASVSVANGVLTAQVRLSGDALAQVLAAGSLTTQITLSGAALMQALASAGLTTSPAGLSANASATATASGQLSTGVLLLGEASCLAIAEGGLTTAIQMTGAAVSVSTATGDLTVTSGFTAAALAQATAAGTLSTQIQLDAAAVMQAIAAASLTTGAQIVAFYDELDAFYGDFAVQCSANGTPFNGILDTTDADQFGSLSLSTHRLRYPAVGSAVTAQGDILVAGVRYKVIEIPRRISRSEMVAELVKQI